MKRSFSAALKIFGKGKECHESEAVMRPNRTRRPGGGSGCYHMLKYREQGFKTKLLVLMAIVVVSFFTSFLVGRYDLSISLVWDILRARFMSVSVYWEKVIESVVVQIRFPRICCAILVGGALSVSGASYQTLFKNPMVSPDLLGVSAGAGFGAALSMLARGRWWQIQLTAFVFGIAAVAAANIIARLFGKKNITVLVLAGVVVSSVFQSLLSIIKTLADTDNVLPSITYWLMGSLGKATNTDLLVMLPATVLSLLLLFLFRHHIDALASGEDEATALGVNVAVTKMIVVVTSTLMTVCAVSICGVIGWIGMVVPHISRIIMGANYSKIVPASFLIGGVFLLMIDNLIRGSTGVDLPLGVLTSLIGTPVFVVLLTRARKAWA